MTSTEGDCAKGRQRRSISRRVRGIVVRRRIVRDRVENTMQLCFGRKEEIDLMKQSARLKHPFVPPEGVLVCQSVWYLLLCLVEFGNPAFYSPRPANQFTESIVVRLEGFQKTACIFPGHILRFFLEGPAIKGFAIQDSAGGRKRLS